MLPGDNGPEDTTLEAWNKTLLVNLTGVFSTLRHGIPYLIDAGGGSIVTIGSVTLGAGKPLLPRKITSPPRRSL